MASTPLLARDARVLAVQDAFDHEAAGPAIADELDVLPGEVAALAELARDGLATSWLRRASAYAFSKCGMPCRSSVRRNVPNSHRGRTMPSHARRRLGRSGLVKPARRLCSRLGVAGVSTVSISVSYPARATRSTSAVMRAVSPGR